MEEFKTVQKVEDGKLLIKLPEEFNNKDVNVRVSLEDEFGDEENWAELPVHKKVELLKTFVGADKFPTIKVGKYDVYYQ